MARIPRNASFRDPSGIENHRLFLAYLSRWQAAGESTPGTICGIENPPQAPFSATLAQLLPIGRSRYGSLSGEREGRNTRCSQWISEGQDAPRRRIGRER